MLGREAYREAPLAVPSLLAGNALRADWSALLPPSRCSYLLGNPPFVGMARMTKEQREDRDLALSHLRISDLHVGRLDYVASWYAKAMHYAGDFSIRMAFVSTNSLTQGEQARSLGPLLSRLGFHLDFAHRTFQWASSAGKEAHVHVVVLGFSKMESKKKLLFDYPNPRGEPIVKEARHINIWLADAPDLVLEDREEPLLPGYPLGTKGSQPTDGNHLLVERDELALVQADPIASRFLRRYVQAKDFLRGGERYCLWLLDARPWELQRSPLIQERLLAVQRVRSASRTPSVRRLASAPERFTQVRQPSLRYLAMPEVSSENRSFIPAAFLKPDVIAGNKLIIFPGAGLWLFAMLQSSMFMAWVRALAGRMKSDISISVHLTYHTFPFPNPIEKAPVLFAAERVLATRARFFPRSLSSLYDPRTMPEELRVAHAMLDEAVDRLFIAGKQLSSDGERLSVLWDRYDMLRKEEPRHRLDR